MRRRLAFACAVAIVAHARPATAADSTATHPEGEVPVIRAIPVVGAVHIDGILDEPAWQAAVPAGGFLQNDPREGEPASEPTEVRVLIGDDAIYIGARMFDREPQQIRAALARRDEPLESDLVELYLDTFHDHQTAFNFRVTPAGAIRDAAVGADGRADNSWDAVWEAGARVDELGWVAEIRIPLSQLPYNAGTDAVWGIQVARLVQRKGELSVFSFTPKREQGGVFRYGHLEGLGRLASRRRLELLPYVSMRTEYQYVDPDNPFRDGSDSYGAAGLDIEYGVATHLTLNATINPDFGQVELDPAVVNLTAFETFFEEKRPFFVEGAEQFRFGATRSLNTVGQPRMFHSRRIGREPQLFVTGPDAIYVDAPTQTTIRGAVKLVGKTRDGWSFAALDALTDRELADYIDSGGTPQLGTVEPLTNYFVGRARRSLAEGRSSVGALVTATHRDLVTVELTDMLRSRAVMAGMDFSHYWANRSWEVDGFVAGSSVTGSPEAIDLTQRSSARYFQRPDAGHLLYDPTRTSLDGYAADLSLVKTSGLHWQGSLSYQSVSPGFEVNDLGFQTDADRRSASVLVAYRENQPGRLFRQYSLLAFTNHSWNFDQDRVFAQVSMSAEAVFQGFWSAGARADLRPRFMDDRLTRGGPFTLRPPGGTATGWVGSDSRRRTTYGLEGSYTWNDAGGWGMSYIASVNARPVTPLLIRLEPTFTRLHLKGYLISTVDDPFATATYGNRYVFSDLRQNEIALATRVNWAFTPRLSLQLYLQPLVSAADATEFKELLAPGTFDFGVYGIDQGTITPDIDGYIVDPDGPGPAAPFPIVEPDFNLRALTGNAVVRWEFRPGSALFFVWQQRRTGFESFGDFDFGRDYPAIVRQPPENAYAIKATWWIGE